MGYRFPGPQGIGPSTSEKVDSGTLARTASRPPGFFFGDTLAKQSTSWTRLIKDLPQSGEEMAGKLGEIYFRTNEDVLDKDDKRQLNNPDWFNPERNRHDTTTACENR